MTVYRRDEARIQIIKHQMGQVARDPRFPNLAFVPREIVKGPRIVYRKERLLAKHQREQPQTMLRRQQGGGALNEIKFMARKFKSLGQVDLEKVLRDG